MSGVSGATSKSHSSSSGSSGSTNKSNQSSKTNQSKTSDKSNQANEARQSLPSNQSNQSNQSRQSQGSRNQDTFESGNDGKAKQKVDIGGGQGSAQVSHDAKTGETKTDGSVDIAHVDASASRSTDAVAERDDHAEIAPGTTASNHIEVGKGELNANLSAGVDDEGAHANAGVSGEYTVVKDEFHVENNTTLVDGEKPLNSKNTIDGEAAVRVEGHANADAYVDKDGNAGAHVDVGGVAGGDANLTLASELSTVDEKGNKEELASGEIDLHGNAGLAAGFKGGFDFKDGKLTTELGFNFTPGVGGGINTKLSADFGNIAKEGQEIAEEIGKGAGDFGYQAQKQLGETLSGIQKFLGGVQIFG
jgi:hypothetical protein